MYDVVVVDVNGKTVKHQGRSFRHALQIMKSAALFVDFYKMEVVSVQLPLAKESKK